MQEIIENNMLNFVDTKESLKAEYEAIKIKITNLKKTINNLDKHLTKLNDSKLEDYTRKTQEKITNINDLNIKIQNNLEKINEILTKLKLIDKDKKLQGNITNLINQTQEFIYQQTISQNIRLININKNLYSTQETISNKYVENEKLLEFTQEHLLKFENLANDNNNELEEIKKVLISQINKKFISKLNRVFDNEKISTMVRFTYFVNTLFNENLKPHNKLIEEITYQKHIINQQKKQIIFLMPDLSFNSIKYNLVNFFVLKEHINKELTSNIWLNNLKHLLMPSFKISISLHLKESIKVDVDNIGQIAMLINKYVVDHFRGILYIDDKIMNELDLKVFFDKDQAKEKYNKLIINIIEG